jgi:N-formylglutamate amidohydrolase
MIALGTGLTLSNKNFSTVLSHQAPSRVIIAVPHDGMISNDYAGLFKGRQSGIRGRDKHVWPIAKDVVLCSLERGVRVDAVRFLMARTYIDANRELPSGMNLDPDTLGQTALDDSRLVPIYLHYHGELSLLVERSIAAFGVERILFIDLRGFGR